MLMIARGFRNRRHPEKQERLENRDTTGQEKELQERAEYEERPLEQHGAIENQQHAEQEPSLISRLWRSVRGG